MEQFVLRYDDHSLWYGTFTHFDQCAVKHGISTRFGGTSREPFSSLNLGLHNGDEDAAVIANRTLFCQAVGVNADDLVTAQQTHGDRVLVVTTEHIGRGATKYSEAIADTDALITQMPGVPLMLFFADCVPVLIVDPVHKAVGIAHAGWKGTLDRIVHKTLLSMEKNFGTRPEDCLAGIAPSVGPCCYEVDGIVIDTLKGQFEEWQQFAQPSGDKWHLDLWGINRSELERAGVKPSNIVVSKVCTACNHHVFFSYRADHGHTGRIGAVIIL